ncbi:MAG TPA: HAMP domain-containing sensor histidine kinase [Pseudonocardiaceae bacterium]|nr:HAMP domain-containing sensor histidine kinase [Pseudonocardiaceae bacterium]
MTLRTRVGLAGGAVVFLALVVASLVLYPSVDANLHQQIDESLVQSADQAPVVASQLKQKVALSGGLMPITTPVNLGSVLMQFVIDPVAPGPSTGFIDVSERDLLVAAGTEPAYFQDASYGGVTYRVFTTAVPASRPGSLVRVARSLSDLTSTLDPLAILLVALTVGGGLLAALGARLAAGRVLRPVHVLTDAVEHVTATRDLTATQDLTAWVDLTGGDEIGRLGRSFATMMTALDDAVHTQRQLVADASHELRTPLTSLTTNLELLAEGGGALDPDAPAMVRAAIDQATELRSLVNDLIDLARYGRETARTEDTRLDLLAEAVLRRATARTPGLEFESALSPCLVHVDPDAVERAIANLVDNAVKWSPPGGRVLITVADGECAVSDEGRGIPEADLPFVFGRFYRSPVARSLPGSGLGLAIVRQVVQTHGGTVCVEPLDRGVRLRFRLPVVPD